MYTLYYAKLSIINLGLYVSVSHGKTRIPNKFSRNSYQLVLKMVCISHRATSYKALHRGKGGIISYHLVNVFLP